MPGPLRFVLFAVFTIPVSQFAQAAPQQAASPQSPVNSTVSATAEADSLMLPDGTPIRVRVANGFSSVNVKVGDAINFVVAFEVLANGVIVIPRHTNFMGKIVSVSPAHRGARSAKVGVIYEPITLPTGETATVRPVLKQHPNKVGKVAEGAGDAAASAAGLFITAGLPLLLLFKKGDEQIVPEGTIETLYLNGPLQISRKGATALQPDPVTGHAFVLIGTSVRRRDLSLPTIFCGEREVSPGSSFDVTELELNPGTYWFSSDSAKEGWARLEALPGHEYIVGRDKHGVIVNEFKTSRIPTVAYYDSGVHPLRLNQENLTTLSPEAYRSLTAEPPNQGKDSCTHHN